MPPSKKLLERGDDDDRDGCQENYASRAPQNGGASLPASSSGVALRSGRKAKSFGEKTWMSGKIFEPGGGGNRHGERIESRVARCGPRRHATRRLTTARAISNRCDRELGTPSSELDLIAGMEAYVLDALTVEPSTVPAASVDQEVASVFVADLRVPSRRVQVHLWIEVHVTVGHPADANEILVELEFASDVGALDLAESDHDRTSIGGRNEHDLARRSGLHHQIFADSSPINLTGLEMI